MQSLSASVGATGANRRHDAALLQALLRHAARPANPTTPYLGVIDGDCGPRTVAALRQFQTEQVFVAPGGRASAVVAGATPGLVNPGDTSWQRLVAAMPAEHADLRVLEAGATVYQAADAADLAAATGALATLTFQPNFASQVQALMHRIHRQYGIAVVVCRNGDRRSFQNQYELLTSGRRVTRAGPGESNHNYGQAVDMGFAGLRWLRRDGAVVENEDAWLHQLDPRQVIAPEAARFWALLRSEGLAIGLFPGPADDHPHLQGWRDGQGIDMADRLADLLNRSGRMRWSGQHQRYQCDLGLGGPMVPVGTAAQVWSRTSPLTAAALTSARRAAAQAAAGRAPGTATAAAAATAADVTAVLAGMRADFEAADANWTAWRAR